MVETTIIVGTAVLSGVGGAVGRSICDFLRGLDKDEPRTKACIYHEEISLDVKEIKIVVNRMETGVAVLEERLDNLIKRGV